MSADRQNSDDLVQRLASWFGKLPPRRQKAAQAIIVTVLLAIAALIGWAVIGQVSDMATRVK